MKHHMRGQKFDPMDKRETQHQHVRGVYRDASKRKSHSSWGSVIMVLFYCAHMWFLRKVLHWQKEVKDLGGKIESSWCCKFEKKNCQPVSAQPFYQPVSPIA